MKINFRVNERPVSVEVLPNMFLLDFLRDSLGLTGTKRGCSGRDCGACAVLIDSRPRLSCRIKMKDIRDKKILTVEGLGTPENLHPIQMAFIEESAFQCGYCTPGMIVRTKALLDQNPEPSEKQIRSYLNTNLCRCTGYLSIIRAVQRASLLLQGKKLPISFGAGIGSSVPDKRAQEKVTGTLKFAGDIASNGMLQGKLLLSPYPSAQILSIDISKALKIHGVRSVLTHKDIPGPNRFGRAIKDQPVLAVDRVRFLGDVVAVVFADTLDIAIKGCNCIDVKYMPIPGLFNPEEALLENVPRIHQSGNLLKQVKLMRGNIAAAFDNSDIVIEETYSTPFVEHAYLEVEGGFAQMTSNEGVTVWFPTQIPFLSRKQVAENLCLPEEKVRIISTHVGGGFGGKNDVTLEILLALGALKTKRPVKIVLSRDESLLISTKRHAFQMRYKTGATSAGDLTVLEADILADAGPYASVSTFVLEQAVIFSGGPYYWPAVNIHGKAVYTNNAIGGAFRGYGINQGHFAIESQMDMMAEAIGMDTLEFRMRNALDVGKTTITGEVLRDSVAIKKTLQSITLALKKQGIPDAAPGKRLGIGVACGYKNIGAGRGTEELGGAIISITSEGRILLLVTAVEMGQQIQTVLCQIASEVIGIDCDKIEIITGDTALVPEGISASAQRQTYISGNAVVKASQKFKTAILSSASKMLGQK